MLCDLPQSYGENGDVGHKGRDADGHDGHGVGFWQAWAIPGVSSFAFCLFFSKLIAYTFLYWLPYYIKSTPIQGRLLSAKQAGDLSTLFDVGGVAGGIMAGHLSDKSGCSAVVATVFTIASVPFLYMYRYYGAVSFGLNVSLMMLAGFFVNGPYALITTAVSADLGTHESLAGNAKALATVTAIIDGMGSIGAAIGPMLTGYISQRGGFDGVFLMLYMAALTAGLLLIKLCIKEVSNRSRLWSCQADGIVSLCAYALILQCMWQACMLPWIFTPGTCVGQLSELCCAALLTPWHFLVLLMLMLLLQLQVVREKEKKPVRIGSGVQMMTVKL
jgi:MFS family permease